MFSAPRNLITSCRLKGNHTFTAQVVTIGNDEGEADPSVKQEGEGETGHSVDEEVEVSGRVGGTDQPMGYIIYFTQAVELYQQKNRSHLK